MATKWRIIGLEGPKGGGKDTVCQMIIDLCPLPVKRFAFADKLKHELVEEMGLVEDILVNGTTDQKDTTYTKYEWDHPRFDQFRTNGQTGAITYREMMTIWGEIRGTNYWVSHLIDQVYDWLEKDPDNIAVISDVRFPEEVKAVQYAGGDLVKIDAKLTDTLNDHPSESNYSSLEFDYLLPGRGKASLGETKGKLMDIMWSSLGVNCRGK